MAKKFSFKYTGSTPVKQRDQVTLILSDESEHKAKVINALASQFTAKVTSLRTR